MRPDNLPILYQNIILGFSSDLGAQAFLWATERPGNDRNCYAAEKFAHEVERIVQALAPMLDAGARLHGMEQHDPDLMAFILQRHANWRMGGNVSPVYAVRGAT